MWAKGAKYSFCNTAHTIIRLMKLCNNLNEVMGNSLIKSKNWLPRQQTRQNYVKIRYFSKIYEFDTFLEKIIA